MSSILTNWILNMKAATAVVDAPVVIEPVAQDEEENEPDADDDEDNNEEEESDEVKASKVPVGAMIGDLTQLGQEWLDFTQIARLDLNPIDGCGAEITFKSGTKIHYSDFGAALIRRAITLKLKPVDELERMHSL